MSDLIISIGTNCEISFNIRNTFQIERAYPFDWWFTPIHSVADILRDRFRLQIDDSNLEHVRTPESVLNIKYGFLHHHDFPRESDLIRSDWRVHIPAVAEKYRALGERFFSDIEQARAAVLVLNGDGAHKAHISKKPSDASVYLEIAATARELFPATHITLAVLNGDKEPDVAALQAASLDDTIVVGPPVKDYGDRNEKARFAKSLRGWSETLTTLRQTSHEASVRKAAALKGP